MHATISETVAPQFQRFMKEMSRRFDEQDRKLDALAAADAEMSRRLDGHGRRLDEHDRKLDVIVARLDGLKLLDR